MDVAEAVPHVMEKRIQNKRIHIQNKDVSKVKNFFFSFEIFFFIFKNKTGNTKGKKKRRNKHGRKDGKAWEKDG